MKLIQTRHSTRFKLILTIAAAPPPPPPMNVDDLIVIIVINQNIYNRNKIVAIRCCQQETIVAGGRCQLLVALINSNIHCNRRRLSSSFPLSHFNNPHKNNNNSNEQHQNNVRSCSSSPISFISLLLLLHVVCLDLNNFNFTCCYRKTPNENPSKQKSVSINGSQLAATMILKLSHNSNYLLYDLITKRFLFNNTITFNQITNTTTTKTDTMYLDLLEAICIGFLRFSWARTAAAIIKSTHIEQQQQQNQQIKMRCNCNKVSSQTSIFLLWYYIRILNIS